MISVRRTVFGSFALFAVTAGTPFVAVALQPTQAQAADPAQFVQGLGDRAIAQLAGQQLPEQEEQARFRRLLEESFDLNAIGKFTVGRGYWATATPEQQKEFLSLYESQVVNAYARRFRDYSGEQFKVTGQQKQDEDSVVASEITRPNGGPPVSVQWRVRPEGGGLKIVDVVVAGISMAVTDRQQFAAVIERGGGSLQALIDALKTQNMPVAQPPAASKG